MIAQWRLVEFDFQALLHLDISELLITKSYRWFLVRLAGIMGHPDSRLAAYFTPETERESPHG